MSASAKQENPKPSNIKAAGGPTSPQTPKPLSKNNPRQVVKEEFKPPQCLTPMPKRKSTENGLKDTFPNISRLSLTQSGERKPKHDRETDGDDWIGQAPT